MASGHNRPRTRRARRDLNLCSDCGVPLSPDNTFNFKRPRYICKPCWVARQKSYQGDKPRTQKRYKLTPEQQLAKSLKTHNGMTPETYAVLLARQNGVCAICRGDTKGRGRFHVDHCHQTGIIRGLLCAKCNLLLGHADDDTKLLRAAIHYLIDPPALTTIKD